VYARFGLFVRALAIVSVAYCGQAFAGSPPLITDDPETPGYRGWELNFVWSYEQTHDGHEMECPLFDFNYGLTSDRDQLKVEWAAFEVDPDGPGGNAEWGISDLLVGYKYRFIDEKDTCTGWMVSFYPQVSSPTGDESRDLGSGQTELLIPFEFQKNYEESKSWINPEIGYNIVFGDLGSQNSWKFGLAMGQEMTDKLEIEWEVGSFVFEGSGHGGEPDDPFFNIGFEYRKTKNINLFGSAGRSFRGSEDGVPEFFAVLGVQVLLGKAAEEEAEEEGDEDNGEKPEDPAKEADAPFMHDHTAHSSHHVRHYLVNPAS